MASRRSYPYPSPYAYGSSRTFPSSVAACPGPRCGHTLTAIAANVNGSQLLVLFGGSTTAVAAHGSLPNISLEGVTNSVHCFDVLTRSWTRINPTGDVPSPRACHAATSLGTMLIVQGGIGPSGPSDGDVYTLDLTRNNLKWHRLMVSGAAPGPRYGHVMDVAAQRWLVIFGGRSGNTILSDTWALDTTGPVAWNRLNPYGSRPSARIYASAKAREDGVFFLCGGTDYSGMPLGDTYALEIQSVARCGWTRVPGVAPSPRYQHTVNACHWGVTNGARLIDVLDTGDSKWLDITGPETSSTSGSNRQIQYQFMRRFHHASASVGSYMYVHGGLKEDMVLDDDPETSNPSSFDPEPEVPSLTRRSSSEGSLEKRTVEEYNLPSLENAFYDCSETEGCFLVLETAVCEMDVGNPRDLGRTPSLDHYLYQSQRDQFGQHNSSHPLHKRVISKLLKPKDWEAPADRTFFLSLLEVETLCNAVHQIFIQEPTVLQLKVPIKVFGDIHGQFGDLMRIFREYGSPSLRGDITHIDYLFLGDYVDRGTHSLETIMLLLCLKIEYPENIHLIRGNHESSSTNRLYGFLHECQQRMGEADGIQAWYRINKLFGYLPLGAVIEKKILCVHGGIGRTVSVEEIASIQRPAFPDSGSTVLKDTLWSDPTVGDSVMGITSNTRGEGVISFGPDIVKEFCKRNKLQMIIRAHECVYNGFETFAQGQLITVFSATNYCGTVKNAGAILVIGKDLVIYPKVIHPDPPSISSSESSPEDNAWMQELNMERPPTPPREDF
ncbi:hypothetical protein CARUB_v10012319mg [Capsella rubella]|uniref:Serine/threonine-protein phosphatase n=1 Tax=Capsella rubella TaxID=81985 RepID=R0GP05_9BRAS|nr:hypothetical protein CARUB_v10012319mg [Capsella rubella]